MTLSSAAYAAFAAASATALTSGTLELLSASGAALATASLGTPTAAGAVTTMGGYPRTVSGTAGTIASARYRTSSAVDWMTDMTVGLTSEAAPPWAPSTVYAVGAKRTAGASQYTATSAGTSASSGAGPTGTGSGISDGSVVWTYLCPANAQVTLSSLTITTGQSVTISSAALTHAAA